MRRNIRAEVGVFILERNEEYESLSDLVCVRSTSLTYTSERRAELAREAAQLIFEGLPDETGRYRTRSPELVLPTIETGKPVPLPRGCRVPRAGRLTPRQRPTWRVPAEAGFGATCHASFAGAVSRTRRPGTMPVAQTSAV